MTTHVQSRDLLKNAFDRFEEVATTLDDRHSALRAEVKRLEGRLQDANRRLEAVLDALDTGVAVSAPDGSLLRTNRAFKELGLCDQDFRLTDTTLKRLARSPSGRAGSVRLIKKTNRGKRHLAATVVPVGDGAGTRVLTVQDVTQIREEEEEGGRCQRLQALGVMAAELAHEVRNPLGSIRLFASMLREDLDNQPKALDMVDHILTSTAGLENTVSNLLAFCSPPRSARRRVNLSKIAAEVCALLSPVCAVRGVMLQGPKTADSRTDSFIHGDPEALRQVVLNLLSNALAATETGGTIHIETRRNGSNVLLRVQDTGCGVGSEDLPRVFDPFFTRTEGGTGLGLSIVHRHVEQHGGRIWFDSESGRGTVVRVEMPSAGCVNSDSGGRDDA